MLTNSIVIQKPPWYLGRLMDKRYKEYGIGEAKSHFSSIINEVINNDETVIIKKYSQPVVQIMAAKRSDKQEYTAFGYLADKPHESYDHLSIEARMELEGRAWEDAVLDEYRNKVFSHEAS